MAELLVHQRCLHHAGREAASRCPGCRAFFCRECVTDHEGRLLCRRCLDGAARVARGRAGWWAEARWALAALAGALFTWATFYYAGSLLASLPSQFHGAAQ